MAKRKIKAIKVVKLNEKEREKFTKKYNCKRCHDFFVDTKEELEFHNEYMHGEYSAIKHQQNRKGSRKLKKLYLNRNKHAKPEESVLEIGKKKRKPRNCFAYRCKNCKHIGLIFGDTSKKLQNLLLCTECGCNIFKDSRLKLIEYLKKSHENDITVRNLSHLEIDIRKFNMEKEIKKSLGVSTNGALEKFMDRRNGKHE